MKYEKSMLSLNLKKKEVCVAHFSKIFQKKMMERKFTELSVLASY